MKLNHLLILKVGRGLHYFPAESFNKTGATGVESKNRRFRRDFAGAPPSGRATAVNLAGVRGQFEREAARERRGEK
jgi:hypothetical protein